MRCHLTKRATNTFATLAILALAFASQAALAGPPYFTDDPVPVEPGHWEINTYSSSTFTKAVSAGALPGIDANYGAFENLQLHVLPSMAYSASGTGNARFGVGDLELGAKYRFLPSEPENWWPQLGVYPLIDFPTGNATAGLGTGRTHAFFPIWAQKEFGRWTTFGGGGYWINPGPGNKNFWFTGWVVQYAVTDTLSLGGEIFHATRSSSDSPGNSGERTGFNLGGTYDFDRTYHLLFSFGRGLQNIPTTNAFSYYVALQLTH